MTAGMRREARFVVARHGHARQSAVGVDFGKKAWWVGLAREWSRWQWATAGVRVQGDSGSVQVNGSGPRRKGKIFLFFQIQFPINTEVENKSKKYLGASRKIKIVLEID
jgi:hypothetical protein